MAGKHKIINITSPQNTNKDSKYQRVSNKSDIALTKNLAIIKNYNKREPTMSSEINPKGSIEQQSNSDMPGIPTKKVRRLAVYHDDYGKDVPKTPRKERKIVTAVTRGRNLAQSMS